MGKCINADEILLYAQDAQETPAPWERWEWRYVIGDTWHDCSDHPAWSSDKIYRRKPKMVSVTLANGEVVSWQEPVRDAGLMQHGMNYYFPELDVRGNTRCFPWYNDTTDRSYLSRGLVHLSEMAAKEHAEALIKINTQGHSDG